MLERFKNFFLDPHDRYIFEDMQMVKGWLEKKDWTPSLKSGGLKLLRDLARSTFDPDVLDKIIEIFGDYANSLSNDEYSSHMNQHVQTIEFARQSVFEIAFQSCNENLHRRAVEVLSTGLYSPDPTENYIYHQMICQQLTLLGMRSTEDIQSEVTQVLLAYRE